MHMAEGSDSVVDPSPTAPSRLAKLRCPQPADISRKRKVVVNPHVASVGLPDVANSTHLSRRSEPSHEQLSVLAGKHFCYAWRL